MLDTVTVIPIILAYTFIGLLFTIIGFIAVHVSHKIYTTVFERLPLDKIVASKSKKKLSASADTGEKKKNLQQQITEKFVEKCTSKRLQIVDVKRESRKVA